jgi:hypothetical protein
VPALADPARQAYVTEIAALMDARTDRIGEHAAGHPPAWATAALGPVRGHPLDRLEWQKRTASIGAWRELSGHSDPADLASTATRSQEPLIGGVSSGPPAGPADALERHRPSYAVLTPDAECCIRCNSAPLRGGDERVPERARRHGLADPGAARGAADGPPGAVPVWPPAVRGRERRAVRALPDGRVNRPGCARRRRDGDHLAARAGDGQGSVPGFPA